MSRTEAIIDENATRSEVGKVKEQVINAGYPTDKLHVLWGLINNNHKDDYPNIIEVGFCRYHCPNSHS